MWRRIVIARMRKLARVLVLMPVRAVGAQLTHLIKESKEHLDHENQCGFRNSRGCSDPSDGSFTIKALFNEVQVRVAPVPWYPG
jgi:hypothetical protein